MLDESCRQSPTASCLLAHARARATERKFKDIEGLRQIAKIEERMGDTAAAANTITAIIDADESIYISRDIEDLLRLAGREVALKSVAKLDANFRQKFGTPPSPSNRALWSTASDLAVSYVTVGNTTAALDLLDQPGRDAEFRSWVASAIFGKTPATAENRELRLRLAEIMNQREQPSVAAAVAYLELGEMDKAIALAKADPDLVLNARRSILKKNLDVEATALIKAMPDSSKRDDEYQELAKAFLEKGDNVRAGHLLAAAFADYDLPGRIDKAQKVTYRSVTESWRLSSLVSLVEGMARVGIAGAASPSLRVAYHAAEATEDLSVRFLLTAPIAIAMSKIDNATGYLDQARNLARINPKVLAWDCESLMLGAQLGLVDEALAVARREDGQSFCGSVPVSLELIVIGSLVASGYLDEAESTLFSLSSSNLDPRILCGGVMGLYMEHLIAARTDKAVSMLERNPQCRFPFGMSALLVFSQINAAVKEMTAESRFDDALRIIRLLPKQYRANYLNTVADGLVAVERPSEALQILEEARSSIPEGECRLADDLLSIAMRMAPLSPSRANRFLKDVLDIMADRKSASCASVRLFADAAMVASQIAQN